MAKQSSEDVAAVLGADPGELAAHLDDVGLPWPEVVANWATRVDRILEAMQLVGRWRSDLEAAAAGEAPLEDEEVCDERGAA